MLCPKCRETHGLYTFHTCCSGLTETHHAWVSKKLLADLAEAMTQIREEKISLGLYLEKWYGDVWRSHFKLMSRKNVWLILTENGKHYPSLSTFYNHIRHSGIIKKLNDYLRYDDLEIILRILKINDEELESRAKTIRDLERLANLQEEKIRQSTYKKSRVFVIPTS